MITSLQYCYNNHKNVREILNNCWYVVKTTHSFFLMVLEKHL